MNRSSAPEWGSGIEATSIASVWTPEAVAPVT